MLFRSGEEKDTEWQPCEGNNIRTKSGHEYQGSILEHILIQHLTQFYDVGEHNHMRLRGADWNDALDMANERGESVAFTSLYGSNLTYMAELLLILDERGTKEVSILKELEILLADDIELFDDTSKKQSLLKNYCETCRHIISGDRKSVV